ncbi:hypothetical protein [Dactylosporangium matsuzakiense]|uniref:hypothetical protein n=1 Tax=Dactylosporangium matsuzakiense TaxID=53360 RepID=UPI0021C29B98|nr:hypothetical protein [Dactylosporangium matsuzakiense]UWZ41742.1 hypothetical protein Dmats_29405 [Dactylosporangium matsuzakiense]
MSEQPPASGPRPPAWNRPHPPPNVPISGELLPPPGGYRVPPPPQQPATPVTSRIPDNLPFVARPSAIKRLIVTVPIAVVALLLVGCPLGFVLTADGPSHTSGDIVALVALLGCLGAAVALGLGLGVFLVASGGPVLALAPSGMWIKTRPTRGQAIWLPWEGIAEIRRRRWALDKMLVVKPRDPRVEGSLGAFTAIDSSVFKLFYGSGFTATLNFADRSEDEILAAVRQFSNGRTQINI